MAERPALRIGVLSTARIGRDLVIPAIQRSERCRVVAVASRDADTAEAFADECGVDRAFGSYAALLSDPHVDAVYNPLPNHLHTEWNLAAIEAGKHVLAEKPLATDAAEAEAVFAAAGRADVSVVEAFMYRSHPTWRTVQRLIATGEIGGLRHVQTYFGYRNLDPHDIRNIAQYGGGALMDVGCYTIDSACLLFGDPPDVIGATMTRHPEFGTDVVTSALLRYGAGTAGFTCATALEHGQWVRIVGTGGRIDVEIPFNIPTDLTTRIHLVRGGDPPVAPVIETVEFEPCDQYTTQADAFAAHVIDGAPPNVAPHESVTTMRTIDRILEVAEERAFPPEGSE